MSFISYVALDIVLFFFPQVELTWKQMLVIPLHASIAYNFWFVVLGRLIGQPVPFSVQVLTSLAAPSTIVHAMYLCGSQIRSSENYKHKLFLIECNNA